MYGVAECYNTVLPIQWIYFPLQYLHLKAYNFFFLFYILLMKVLLKLIRWLKHLRINICNLKYATLGDKNRPLSQEHKLLCRSNTSLAIKVNSFRAVFKELEDKFKKLYKQIFLENLLVIVKPTAKTMENHRQKKLISEPNLLLVFYPKKNPTEVHSV